MVILDLCLSVFVLTLCSNRALRMALKEYLQHSKGSRGGSRASKQAGRQREGRKLPREGRKEASGHLFCILCKL